jgi:hypothetical protein
MLKYFFYIVPSLITFLYPNLTQNIQDYQWNKLIEAIIQVESRGNSILVGKDNDVGVLQITPIYLKECNRLLGREKYILEDRYDSLKSVEMFNIIQAKHNKNRNIAKAITLHNPGGGKEYYNKVIKQLKK